jgi:hypothetical protein
VVLIFTTFIFLADILFADFQFIFDPDANVSHHPIHYLA